MVPTKAVMKGIPRAFAEEFAGTSGATNTKGNKGKKNPRKTVQSHKKASSCIITRETEQQGSVLSGDKGMVQILTLNLLILNELLYSQCADNLYVNKLCIYIDTEIKRRVAAGILACLCV